MAELAGGVLGVEAEDGSGGTAYAIDCDCRIGIGWTSRSVCRAPGVMKGL